MIESTVIMSCYKSNKSLLKKSILSILNQSYKKFEFLIVQDGPDSDLELVLKSFLKKDKRIRILKNKAGKFFFNVIAGNNKVIATSQGYKSENSLKKGIESVQKNATKKNLS